MQELANKEPIQNSYDTHACKIQKAIDEVATSISQILKSSDEIQKKYQLESKRLQLEYEIEINSSLFSSQNQDSGNNSSEDESKTGMKNGAFHALNYHLNQSKDDRKENSSAENKSRPDRKSMSTGDRKEAKSRANKSDFQNRLDSREEIFKYWNILTEEENSLKNDELSPKKLKRLIRNNCHEKIAMIESYKPQQKRIVQQTSEKSLRDMNIPPIQDFLKYLESKAIENPAEEIDIENIASVLLSESKTNKSSFTGKKSKYRKQKTVVKKRKKAVKQVKKSKNPQEEAEASLESVIRDPYHLTSIQNLPVINRGDNELKYVINRNTIPMTSSDDTSRTETISLISIGDDKLSNVQDSDDFRYDTDDFESATTNS